MTGIKKYAVLALGAIAALCSCIDDNLSGCPPSREGESGIGTPRPNTHMLRIGFENVKPEYAAEVKRMDIFVFDREEKFTGVLSEKNISLTSDFQMQAWLSAGNYRLVGWSDLGGHYMTDPAEFETGVTTFDEAVAMLDITGGSVIDYNLNTLVHGNEKVMVTTYTSIKLPLVQNTYKINVVVEGLEKRHNYTVAITDDNGNYYFDNTFAPSGALQYKRRLTPMSADKFSASLTILRLDRSRSPKFTLTDNTTQSVLLEKNLVRMLLALEDDGIPVDFSTQHEFTTHIVYDQATLSATISIVSGWNMSPGKPADLD
jgi:hypothetical protein